MPPRRRRHLVPVPNPAWHSLFVIDPGVWTGWCWIGFSELDMLDYSAHELLKDSSEAMYPMCLMGQMDASDENSAVHALVSYVIKGQQRVTDVAERTHGSARVVTHVASEDFVIRERTKDRSLLSPVRLNAKLSYALEDLGYPFDETQTPSDAKKTVTNERLQRWGLWVPGMPHQMDAVRHTILYMRRMVGPIH